MSASIVLVRHASSVGQAPEAALSEAGVGQARDLATLLHELDIDAVFSSPYRRAIDTARPFADAAGLAITRMDDLRERVLSPTSQPDWLDHVRQSFSDPSYSLPGGESLADVAERGLRALGQIAQVGSRKPVACAHGNLIAAILHHIDPAFGFDDWRTMTNPDLFDIQLSDGVATGFQRITLP